MSFNPEKCSVIHVSSKENPLVTSYQLHGHILERDRASKYLGITISQDLKWNTQISNITTKAIAIPASNYMSQEGTPGPGELRVIFTNKDTYRNSFFPRTVKQWNALPSDVAGVTKVDQFKAMLDRLSAGHRALTIFTDDLWINDNMERSWNEVLQSLFKTSTVEVEQEALRQLHMKLTREAKQVEKAHELGDGEKCSPDVVNNGVSSASPYNGIFVTVMIKDADTLNKFVCYVFERRYGWSEAGREGSRRVRRMSSTGVTLGSSDGQQKAIINDLLDNLIKWISTQEICHQLLDAFCYTLKQVTEMPVVRNRAVIHLMEWLKGNKDILYDNKNFPHILSLINVALSDVWSAIRSSCAKQLGHIYTSFNSKEQESIFSSLAKSCTCDKSSWQAKEGAIMGINSILHQYRDGSESMSHTPVFSLSMSQDNTISCVPGFISQSIHFVVFKLLYDQQLTIRENAAKALSTYITCANVHEASSTFKKVMEQLQQGVTYSRHDHDKRQDGTTREGADIVNLPVEFLDAYAAEGLLNVCQFLVKVLPLRELLPFWPQHISTFLIYLSHPASTVRQASSTVFKCLVSKCSHFGVLIKLVIQSLVEGWETDISVLQREEHKGELTETLPSVTDNTNVPLCDTWESREGRLFAFELIMQFLIKNHWVYTFGPAGIGAMRNENCESAENNNEEREKSSENLGFHNRKRIHSVSELHFKSQGSMAVKTIQEHTSTQ
ncbi:hypothetical protein FSP39_011613 [Pinctada imbricata]|uniref:Uncharacterized protein n=1 Tax=Pinctada imbricata TaxID=66713 RepID=A0AA89BX89_PINIB|nr:hypothetical protein FSP39_011613 [Pinctada imbricata]